MPSSPFQHLYKDPLRSFSSRTFSEKMEGIYEVFVGRPDFEFSEIEMQECKDGHMGMLDYLGFPKLLEWLSYRIGVFSVFILDVYRDINNFYKGRDSLEEHLIKMFPEGNRLFLQPLITFFSLILLLGLTVAVVVFPFLLPALGATALQVSKVSFLYELGGIIGGLGLVVAVSDFFSHGSFRQLLSQIVTLILFPAFLLVALSAYFVDFTLALPKRILGGLLTAVTALFVIPANSVWSHFEGLKVLESAKLTVLNGTEEETLDLNGKSDLRLSTPSIRFFYSSIHGGSFSEISEKAQWRPSSDPSSAPWGIEIEYKNPNGITEIRLIVKNESNCTTLRELLSVDAGNIGSNSRNCHPVFSNLLESAIGGSRVDSTTRILLSEGLGNESEDEKQEDNSAASPSHSVDHEEGNPPQHVADTTPVPGHRFSSS